MSYTSVTATFFALLLLGKISVVYSAGYVSDACSALCDTDGNRGVPLSSVVETKHTTEYNFHNGQLKETLLAYDTGTADDIAAKKKYGQDINCWDISELTSFYFQGYDTIGYFTPSFNNRLDCWDTSRITSMYNMFRGASAFNQDIGMWDVSGVKQMTNMFAGATTFNQDIGDWDTSNVNGFHRTFNLAEKFNQNINAWDTSKANDFSNMFYLATTFNQDIGDWDTSNINGFGFTEMFSGATEFNQNINGWDTSNGVSFHYMFSSATAFNQDISDWDTSKGKTFQHMFRNAKAFNQDIGDWDTSNAVDMRQMFRGATVFNQNLCDWRSLQNVNTDAMFATSGCEVDVIDIENAVCQSCSPSSSPSFSPTSVVDTNEVLAVGEGGDRRPHGTVSSTIVPLTIVTFFEAHQSLFEGEGGIDEAITIEVFANVAEDENDCTKGTLLENVVEDEENKFIITTESKRYDNYNDKFKDIIGLDYPVTSNGVVGSASVTISDFQYVPTNENKNIWFLGRGSKDGEIELCVVTSIKIDYDNDADGEKEYYVSRMNSKRIISIDLVANIADQVVDTTESKASESRSDAVLEIDVDTFVCNNKNEKVKDDRSYKIGQYFRVCVGPTTEGVTVGYKVENYIELTCGERSLINAGVVDSLTNIDTEYKNEKLAVRSVLTANDANGKASATCRGKVRLSYATPTAGTVRYLKPSTELVTSGAAGKESLEGLFEMNIKMDIPGIESSAPPLTTPTTIIIGLGSVLSFVGVFLFM